MLRLLSIRNLAVIERLDVEFQPGLNILSGETGSGKSVILDAIELLLGARATPDLIRTGEGRAAVEGVFEAAGNRPLLELLDRAGIEAEDEVVLRREIAPTGRGRLFINHQPATLALLREIQPHLVDIHGQGDQQSLLISANHLYLLDAFAGLTEDLQELEVLYEAIAANMSEIERLADLEASRLQQLDILRFQIDEIDRARLVSNEDQDLESERTRLANAERITERATEAFAALYEDNASVLSRLGLVIRRCQDLKEFDARFEATIEQLEAAKFTVEEVSYFLRSYLDRIQASPERLRVVEERLIEVDRLKRKYGGSIRAVEETAAELNRRLEELEGLQQRSTQMEAALERSVGQYKKLSRRISGGRRKRALEFAAALERELPEVALEKAEFSVRLIEGATGGLLDRLGLLGGLRVTRYGEETAEFYFTANPGEDARPLRDVASGGELSRLMLLLKQVTAPTIFPRTLVFDEIDAGIGGRVADFVGSKLKRLAAHNQVLCVTHQAPMACYADAHYRVWKLTEGGRTTARIVLLDEAERVEELARMLGGSETTPLARRHARELIRQRN